MQKRLNAFVCFATALLVCLGFTSVTRAAGVVSTCDQTHLTIALSGGGLVMFACSGDITLTSTITISANTTIDATGYSVTLDGQHTVQVLSVNAGVTLSLNNLTIANANGGFLGGGVYNSGTVIVTNSTFSGNNADGAGGGIYNSGGTAIIINSAFLSNSAQGAIGTLGGGMYNRGTMIVTNSTFSGDSANEGGGIYSQTGTVTITSSTFSGNSANSGAGGGIGTSGTLTLKNTILANNGGGDCANFGTPTDGGYNLDDDGTCGLKSANHSFSNDKSVTFTSTSPQSNGGPTATLALQYTTSPANDAIAAIPAGTNGCTTTIVADERGVARPGSLTGNCSIGAYEYAPAATSTITDCTDDKQLQSAVSTGGRIVFACSGDIPLTNTLAIGTNTAIDATGYSVTLDGQHTCQVLYHGSGVLILNNVTIANGIASGIYSNATLIVTNSTVSDSSGGTGGGFSNDISGTAIIANSTFSGNSAGAGGAIVNYGTLTLANSTVSGNTAGFGAGIYQDGIATLENTLVANNTGGDCGEGGGQLRDRGYNLDDDGTCPFSSSNNSFSNSKNASLGSLSSNGGVTQTIPLLYPSVAIDAIPIGMNGCGLSADQRGIFRPQGVACDIGAYEANQIPVLFTTSPANLSYTVGPNTYSAPQAPFLVVGGQYTISTTSPQLVSSGIYEFSSWSDGGAISHMITAAATTTSYTANFTETATNISSGVTPILRAVGYNKNTGVSTFNYTITNKSTTQSIPGPIQVVMLSPANGTLAVNRTGIVQPQGYAYWTINSTIGPKGTVGIILEVVTHNPSMMLSLSIYSGHF
jgi:hypothetical protein